MGKSSWIKRFCRRKGNFSNNQRAAPISNFRESHAYETFHYDVPSLLPQHCIFQVFRHRRYSRNSESANPLDRISVFHGIPLRREEKTFPISSVTQYRAYRNHGSEVSESGPLLSTCVLINLSLGIIIVTHWSREIIARWIFERESRLCLSDAGVVPAKRLLDRFFF